MWNEFEITLFDIISSFPRGQWVNPCCTELILGNINSFLPGQNGNHFADGILGWIFVNEKFCIFIKVKLIEKKISCQLFCGQQNLLIKFALTEIYNPAFNTIGSQD